MLKRNLRVVREGERSSPQGKPVYNRILLALPDNEFRSIRPHLEFLPLPHHRLLYEPNRKIDFLYFPNRGLISLVIVMEDGKTVEVAVLGREGFAGVPAVFGLTVAAERNHRLHARHGADSEPQESGSIRLRVLSNDSAVQWRD